MLRPIFTVQLFFLSVFLFSQNNTDHIKVKSELTKSYLEGAKQIKEAKNIYNTINKGDVSIEKQDQLNTIRSLYNISNENIEKTKELIDYMRRNRSTETVIDKVRASSTKNINKANGILSLVNEKLSAKYDYVNDLAMIKFLNKQLKSLNKVSKNLKKINDKTRVKLNNTKIIKAFEEVN